METELIQIGHDSAVVDPRDVDGGSRITLASCVTQPGQGNQDAAQAASVCFDPCEDDVIPSTSPIESSGFPAAPQDHAASPESERVDVRVKKNKREFERTLRDAGFSRSEAKAITASAYAAYAQRDADADGEIITALQQITSTIKA